MLHLHQSGKRNHIPVLPFHTDVRNIKIGRSIFRHQHYAHSLFTAVFSLYAAYPDKLPFSTPLYGLPYILRSQARIFQLLTVIGKYPFHRHGSRQLHLVHSLYLCQHRFYSILSILLNHRRLGRSIQRIRKKRSRSLRVRLFHADLRIPGLFRELLPYLPDSHCHVKAHSSQVDMLVKRQ